MDEIVSTRESYEYANSRIFGTHYIDMSMPQIADKV